MSASILRPSSLRSARVAESGVTPGILAGVLVAGPRWRAAVVVMAAFLGFSRVYLGYHYPSDVVAGWALAVVWLALWAIIADRRTASAT